MNTQANKTFQLIIWITALIGIGWGLGHLTQSNVDTWYVTLNRSSHSPPNYVFGIVWTVLYAMIATSGWLIWNSDPFPELPQVKRLYISQLVLNWSWTPIFFGLHLPGVALACLGTIVILVGKLIAKTYERLTIASLLLMPYFAWSVFAAYLNFFIWQNN